MTKELPGAARAGANARMPPSCVGGLTHFGTPWSWPFDSVRWAYANAVQAGWLPRSLRMAGRLEHALASAERCALGPWARQV